MTYLLGYTDNDIIGNSWVDLKMPICDSGVKQSRLAGYCSWLLTIVVFTAITSGPATSQKVDEPDVFLWGGKALAEYNGQNADYIRRLYQPVVEDYPDLTSCISSKTASDFNAQFAMSDIRNLTSVEAKEVCIFYALSRLGTIEEIINEIENLGFHIAHHLRLSEHDVRADWKSTNGSILGDGALIWFQELLASSWVIVVRVGADGKLESVRISGSSIVQL